MAGGTAPIDLSAAPSAQPVSVADVREWISAMDVGRLSDRERLDLVADLERVKHTAAATQARATHALRQSREVAHPQDAVRSVGSEVALARRQSPTVADRFVGVAHALVDEMPLTMQALDAGLCSERHAEVMVQATSVLTLEHRAEVDRRVGPLLGRLGVRGAERAARRVAQELDVAAVLKRMQDAVRSRRVTTRPAPDGMAYLTVLGPMVEVVGAAAALRARGRSVVSGQCPEEDPAGRGIGAVEADTALQLLSGRAAGQVQPVEVHLVMTDRSLLGTGDPDRSVMEPARVPGHGSIPAPVARAWVRGQPPSGSTGSTGSTGRGEGSGAGNDGGTADSSGGNGSSTARGGNGGGTAGGNEHGTAGGTARGGNGGGTAGGNEHGAAGGTAGGNGAGKDDSRADRAALVWLRRLYTSPDGRDLVAMDSRRRHFTGLLRRMLVLRDDVCRTPWCEAPIAHADHTVPARDQGATSFAQGGGRCARCNYGKEARGWAAAAPNEHEIRLTTPLGHSYVSRPPPLLGWGATPPQPNPVPQPNPLPQPNPESAPSSAATTGRAPARSNAPTAPARSNAATPPRSHPHRVPAHRDPDRARRRELSRARLRLNRVRGTQHLEQILSRLLL